MDKKITCKECGQEFTFTKGEQDWFFEHQLNEPKRCVVCRNKRKDQNKESNHEKQDKKAV